jgi:ubiquinone/menaquinone biosynthesis C-methylase UbiE
MNDDESAMPNKQVGQSQSEAYAAQTAYRDKTVAAQYEQRRFSNWRGRLGDWLDKRAFNLALKHLPRDGGIILDIPCGTGRVTAWIVEAGYKVVGADIAVEMIAVARDRPSFFEASLGYIQTDAVHLPFRSKTLSCVTAIRFWGHIPSATRVQVLRELARVSQGYVIADYCVFNPMINIRHRVDHWFRSKSMGFNQSWTWQSIPRHQLEREFQAADLKAVKWFAKLRFLSDAWIVLLAHEDRELE